MILGTNINNASNADQMAIVFSTVKGGDDYAHDLRCGFALAIHNGSTAADASHDAVEFANNKGRSTFERTTVI